VIVPAVTVKVAVVAEAAIVAEAGVVRRALLSARVTVVAEVAAFVKATVQVLEALDPKVVGVQVNDDSVTVDDKLIERVFDMPLKVAVTIAD
jgi:hypothetical protein